MPQSIPFEGVEQIMPSALVFENKQSFTQRVARNKGRPQQYGETSIFQNGDDYVVMGREAMSSGQMVRFTGPKKYQPRIIDNMILAALLKVAPEGHDNIIVACGHSTNAIANVDQMAQAIGGIHHIHDAFGKERVYKVRSVIPWDEPAGSLIRFAEQVPEAIEPGKRMGIVDIGGRISSMYAAEALDNQQIQVYWNEGGSFDSGIQNVTERLEEEMRGQYPDVFNTSSLSPVTLELALRSGKKSGDDKTYSVNASGYPMDVTQSVFNATGPLLTRLLSIYADKLRGGVDLDYMIITGGGAALLFNEIRDEVLGHAHVYPSDDLKSIQMANMRGAWVAANAWVVENHDKAFKKGSSRPLLLTIDPGNSYTKYKATWL